MTTRWRTTRRTTDSWSVVPKKITVCTPFEFSKIFIFWNFSAKMTFQNFFVKMTDGYDCKRKHFWNFAFTTLRLFLRNPGFRVKSRFREIQSFWLENCSKLKFPPTVNIFRCYWPFLATSGRVLVLIPQIRFYLARAIKSPIRL